MMTKQALDRMKIGNVSILGQQEAGQTSNVLEASMF